MTRYRIIVHKPFPRDRASGLLVPHSNTVLDVPLEDAKKAARAMRMGLPPGFLVELQDADTRHTIKV
jgi:hypothetical protein